MCDTFMRLEDHSCVIINWFVGEELYDLSLLKNQILAVFPGAVFSSRKFFMHIEPHRAQNISQQITELAAKPQVDI